MEKLLDKENLFYNVEDKQKASQILRALEGLSVWKAKELLEKCAGVLDLTEIHYK